MDAPHIQYATASDGVSIAYWIMGKGPVVVEMQPLLLSHLEMEWEMPGFREAHERAIQRGNTVLRYDARGSGLSDRDVTDFSVEALVRDIQAVADHAGLERFGVHAFEYGGPVGIAFAAANTDRVSHLLLWHTAARGTDLYSEQWANLLNLMRQDWRMGSEALFHSWLGWRLAEFGHQYAAMMREAVSRETYLSFWDQVKEWDVRPLLPAVTTPTMVAHRRRYPYVNVDAARKLAASIKGARLMLFERSTAVMTPEVAQAVSKWMLETTAPPPSVVPILPSGTAVILFADIVDSTALTERLGDAAFREKTRDLDGALRAIIREHSGTCIDAKTLGDGVLATFASASQAIAAALACGKAGDEGGLPLHLGLHAGDVIREDNNVFGGAVNVAARISGLSAPGEVLVSDIVRGLARTSASVVFEDRGEQALKGVGEPVRVWAVVAENQEPRTETQ